MKSKTKLSNQEIRMLLIGLALIMVAVSYFLVFNKAVKSAEEIEAQNAIDQQRVTELEMMEQRQDEVIAETEAYKQEVLDIIEKYPTDVPTEKAIMVIEGMEHSTNVHVSSINLLMNNLIGTVSGSATTVDAEGNEIQVPSENARVGYYDALSMNYEGTYEDVKGMAEYIAKLKDRMTVPAITMSFDTETGNLSGTFTVNMYYLTNTDKEYIAPSISGIGSGVPDIFKSGSGNKVINMNVEGDDSEENDEEMEKLPADNN